MGDTSGRSSQTYPEPVPSVKAPYQHQPGVVTLLKEAVSYQSRRIFIEALSCYKQALHLDPDDPETLQLYGSLQLQMRDDSCLDLLVRAHTLMPEAPHVGYNLGLAYRHHSRYREAIPYVQDYLKAMPQDSTAWLVLSGLGVDTQNVDLAFQGVLEAIGLGRNDHLLMEHNADVHRKLGRLEDAISIYKDILRKWPESHGTRLNLGLLQLQIGDLEEGWENYEARFLVHKYLQDCPGDVKRPFYPTGGIPPAEASAANPASGGAPPIGSPPPIGMPPAAGSPPIGISPPPPSRSANASETSTPVI